MRRRPRAPLVSANRRLSSTSSTARNQVSNLRRQAHTGLDAGRRFTEGFRGSRVQIPPSRLREEQASHCVAVWGFFPHYHDPLYVHQAVRRRSVPRRRSATTHRPASAPVHAAAGLARALLTSAPATRPAERAPLGYITPTI